MVEPDGDLYPDFVPHTGALVIVLVELGLVEVLRYVEDEPGNVTEDVHHHDGRQGDGRVGQGPAVLEDLFLRQHENINFSSFVT